VSLGLGGLKVEVKWEGRGEVGERGEKDGKKGGCYHPASLDKAAERIQGVSTQGLEGSWREPITTGRS